MNKLSVVISAYNEKHKIKECLESVKFAKEIIFVDNTSSDNTVEIARKYTEKIFTRPNNPMLNINKNYGFSKATGDWVFSLDADERVTEELRKEILSTLNSQLSTHDGFWIPRKNIIFGKWIEHTGWYPDYQLRLFKNGSGKFREEHVHEILEVRGETGRLESHIIHYNYENISQFLQKMIQIYTISEAENLIRNGYVLDFKDVMKMPFQEFLKRFFSQQGYKDGIHGLVLSLLMAFYHLIVFTRLWEQKGFKENRESMEIFKESFNQGKKEINYWLIEEKIEQQKNILGKVLLRLKRKLSV